MEEESHLYIWTILLVAILWILLAPKENEGFWSLIKNAVGAAVTRAKSAIRGNPFGKGVKGAGTSTRTAGGNADNIAESSTKNVAGKVDDAADGSKVVASEAGDVAGGAVKTTGKDVAEAGAKKSLLGGKAEFAGTAALTGLGLLPLFFMMGGSGGGDPRTGEDGAPLSKAQLAARNKQALVMSFVCVVCCCCCLSMSLLMVVAMS